MKKRTFTIVAGCLMAAVGTHAQVVIDVDAQQRGPKISPTHYGIFFEDINHAADGGIYAELIRNRSFEDGEGYDKPATMEAWSTCSSTPAQLNISHFTVKQAHLIRLSANDGMDENTLQQPTNIYPTHHELSPIGNKVEVELPAYSLSIIRIKE